MPYVVDTARCRDYAVSSRLEWCLPNGLGGYAMGTVAGANTRRYHGLLVAAVRPPANRTLLLASVEAYVTVDAESVGLSTNQYVGAVHPEGFATLKRFRVGEVAEWTHEAKGAEIVRQVYVHPQENAVTVRYENRSAKTIGLTLRPLVAHRVHHENFRVTDFYPEFMLFPEGRTLIEHRGVRLALVHPDADRTPTTGWYYRFEHPRESERGLDPIDDLFCPCELRYVLAAGESVSFVAGADPEPTLPELPPMPESDEDGSVEAQLVTACRKFLVKTETRTTIIAGYPWFTDWGRDTMIALPGVCLETGHLAEAREILRGYASQMKTGLVPNRFVEVGETPEYNTVDATLWFANAIHLTLAAEWDEPFAREAASWLAEIIEWHQKGTWYGIGVDPADGLLRQGEAGVQLTWMDAKVGEWVVTPRHGKPVEINGLWYNALCVAAALAERLGLPSEPYREAAARVEAAFESKFWRSSLGHYLDTVDPMDASLRPNQVIAMGLPFCPMVPANARRALDVCARELLTPNGLRTLAPSQPGYHGRYEGPLNERDAAYHQGTAWPWLLGSFVSAVLRFGDDTSLAQTALARTEDWLRECGLGGIAEVYDGDPPQEPGGCPWQAWSAAEVLRAWRAVTRS